MEDKKICILGTGDFGRALAKPMLHAGYQVVFGSRHPKERNLEQCDEALSEARVVGIVEALQASSVVVLAMHPSAQAKLASMKAQMQGKILVDVSNVQKVDMKMSNAEKLQAMFPMSTVVKAFNTVSAYALMTGLSMASLDVHVAGDNHKANQVVMDIAGRMGFNSRISGGIITARQLEASQGSLFQGWGAPFILSLFTFAAWLAYGIVRYHYIKDHEWSRVPVNTMNKVLGCAAITLLSLCFLPGGVASFTQLVYGTKHRRFPAWLDNWLKMRKQIGLMALWLACVHCILSVAHLNPGYFAKWYPVSKISIPMNQSMDISVNLSPRMTWIGECVIAFGTFALGFMVVLGITSLPSVGARMNWKQWTFVQSYLGHSCLFLAAVHVSFNAVPSWGGTPFVLTVQKMSFLSLMLPYFTLFIRLVLLLPCFGIYVRKIRDGWERGMNNKIEESEVKYSPLQLNTKSNDPQNSSLTIRM